MAKKKEEVNNSESENEEKSEEFVRFENALKAIFSLTPEQAKAIRESPVPKDPEDQEEKGN